VALFVPIGVRSSDGMTEIGNTETVVVHLDFPASTFAIDSSGRFGTFRR